MNTFEEFGIKKSILDGIKELGFEHPFPIQEAAIPALLAGRDVVGQAHTGTGKTAAYSISMLQDITPNKKIQGLIIAPTRELAIQITGEIRKFGKYTGIKATTIYGGQGMGTQLEALKNGVEILVATPGRLIDHVKRGSIQLNNVSHLVLDEADTMLDMGFIEDIEFILDLTPKKKLMSLFSATMPTQILRLSEDYLKNPKHFLLDVDDLSVEGIDQEYLVIKDRDKSMHVINFINENRKGQTIVFCSTKYRTRDVATMLRKNNFNAVIIEGDMSQHRREQSMSKFRRGKADILVATDVASRGIDVPQVALVINYDIPILNWSWLGYNIALGPYAEQGFWGVIPFIPILLYMFIHVNYYEELYFRKSKKMVVVWALMHIAMGIKIHLAIIMLPIGFLFKYIYDKKGIRHSYAMHFATNILVVIALVLSFIP